MCKDTTLFFATSPVKEVFKQLHENPCVEIMASESKEFVKVSGKADSLYSSITIYARIPYVTVM